MKDSSKPFYIHAGLNAFLYLEKNELLHSLVISNYNKENKEEVNRFNAIINKLSEKGFRVISAEELNIYDVEEDKVHIMKIDDDKNIINTIKEMEEINRTQAINTYLS